jgi:hypothetical protein
MSEATYSILAHGGAAPYRLGHYQGRLTEGVETAGACASTCGAETAGVVAEGVLTGGVVLAGTFVVTRRIDTC